MEELVSCTAVQHSEPLLTTNAVQNVEKEQAHKKTENAAAYFCSEARSRPENKKHHKYRTILQLIRWHLATVTPRSHYSLQSASAPSTASADDTDLQTSSQINILAHSSENGNCEIIELPLVRENVVEVENDVESPAESEPADCTVQQTAPAIAPSVYEDAYCAVTADGVLHVSEYYLTSDLFASNRLSNYDKRSSKNVRLADVEVVFHADAAHSSNTDHCRQWGLSKNSVWWAADMYRNKHENAACANVVVRCERTSPLQIGFTVVNITAFTGALKVCGLTERCRFVAQLPRSSDDILKFIDETNDEITADVGTKENQIEEEAAELVTPTAAVHLP